MRQVWCFILVLVATCLPGCRGCERNVRTPIPGPSVDPDKHSPGPEKPLTPDRTGVNWQDPGDGSVSLFTAERNPVAIYASEPRFRIEVLCGDGDEHLQLQFDYGCISSPAITFEVVRAVNRWAIYEVFEKRGDRSRTLYVSDPESPPAPGCAACSPWSQGLRGVSGQILPNVRVGLSESPMSLAAYSVEFDWQVIPRPTQGHPRWSDQPTVRGPAQVLRSDGDSATVNVCRPELAALAAASEAEFVVGARLRPADWPAQAEHPGMEVILWSKPIPIARIREQVDVLDRGELPVDPGIGPGRVQRGVPGLIEPESAPPRRRGTSQRTVVRRVDPPASVPSEPPIDATPALGERDRLVQESLELPENAGFRRWLAMGADGHEFSPPPPDGRLLSKNWPTGDGATVDVGAIVDVAKSRALQEHFGVSGDVLPAAYLGGDEVRVALEDLAKPLLRLHGIDLGSDSLTVDYEWVVGTAIPVVRPMSQAVRDRVVERAGRSPGVRADVEALAGFVQDAIPYVSVGPDFTGADEDGRLRCGVRTPAETLLAGGDCDSKSLLLASMIRSLHPGLPVALVFCISDGTPHMMLAVGCGLAPDEDAVTVTGVPHVLIETTGSFPVGVLPTGVSDIEVRPLRMSAGS